MRMEPEWWLRIRTEVGDAIMENGGSGGLEKLLEETHGSLEKGSECLFLRRSENFEKGGRTEKRQQRKVQGSVEKSLVMLEIFRCVWGVVELMLQKTEEGKWGERQVGSKSLGICLIFLCELASEGKRLCFRGCTQYVNKNEEFLLNYISVEIYDKKSVLLDCCVVVSVDLWVVEDQGE